MMEAVEQAETDLHRFVVHVEISGMDITIHFKPVIKPGGFWNWEATAPNTEIIGAGSGPALDTPRSEIIASAREDIAWIIAGEEHPPDEMPLKLTVSQYHDGEEAKLSLLPCVDPTSGKIYWTLFDPRERDPYTGGALQTDYYDLDEALGAYAEIIMQAARDEIARVRGTS